MAQKVSYHQVLTTYTRFLFNLQGGPEKNKATSFVTKTKITSKHLERKWITITQQ